MRFAIPLISITALALAGCLEGSTDLTHPSEPEILLRVTGGLVGVDYTLLVDGRRGVALGQECVSGCGFQDGATLHGLTPQEVEYLALLFEEAGIRSLDKTDFGTRCCDQLHYELRYTDPLGATRVEGSSEALPPELREAIEVVAGYGGGTFPIVVDMGTDPSIWPRDSAVLDEVGLEGHFLRLTAAHGGGCAAHHYNLVAYGGWMESFPVRVRVFFSHDGNNDPCDALLTRQLAFDLRPLRAAYEAAYGAGEPGQTTVMLELENLATSSTYRTPLPYVF